MSRRCLFLKAPPLDGEDGQVAMPAGHGFGSRGDPNLSMGWGGVSGKAPLFIDVHPHPTPPHQGGGQRVEGEKS